LSGNAKGSTFEVPHSLEHNMSRSKDKTLSIRTTDEVKSLLRLAAAQEHRSVASMIEVLVLAYASEHNLKVESVSAARPTPNKVARAK
jgi:hypothetical protein